MTGAVDAREHPPGGTERAGPGFTYEAGRRESRPPRGNGRSGGGSGTVISTVVPTSAWLRQREHATQGLDPVGESDQPGAGGGVGAPTAVVADPDVQPAVADLHIDVDRGGPSVLCGVGQRLGDGVVGGQLDRFGQPAVEVEAEAHGDRGASGERRQRRLEAALRECRRVEATGDLAQLFQHVRYLVRELFDLSDQLVGCGRHRCAYRSAQVQGELGQPMLGSLAQVTFDAAAAGVGSGQEPGTGGREFGLGLRIREGGGDELVEPLQPILGAQRHLAGTRPDDHRAPQSAIHGDRHAGRRPHPLSADCLAYGPGGVLVPIDPRRTARLEHHRSDVPSAE